jgi:hypothetical protein
MRKSPVSPPEMATPLTCRGARPVLNTVMARLLLPPTTGVGSKPWLLGAWMSGATPPLALQRHQKGALVGVVGHDDENGGAGPRAWV